MRLEFDQEEANVVLSALSDMDDFYLPKSIERKDMYLLVDKLTNAMGLKMSKNGELQLPNLFEDCFDISKIVEVDLTQTEMDYIICSLHAFNCESTGHPENISSAAKNIYNRINSGFIGDIIVSSKNNVWEIVSPSSGQLSI